MSNRSDRHLVLVLSAAAALLLLGMTCGEKNQAPSAPTLSGPSSGIVGVEVSFKASSTDPDGDSVAYQFDWGDASALTWSAFIPSGDTATATHTFTDTGAFTIRVKAKNTKDTESEWSAAWTIGICVGRWARTFGGADRDEAYSVQQTSDGGYIVSGITFSYGAGRADVWLIKTDAQGDTVWTRTFGGADYDGGYSVQQTSDGGYIIAGSNASYRPGYTDAWLIKTDANGRTVWSQTYGGDNEELAFAVTQTNDGGYIVCCQACSLGPNNADVWLIKTDATGETAWTRTIGPNDENKGYSVRQTSDGGYVIAGETWSDLGLWDAWLIKTDAAGDTSWAKTFGGDDFDAGHSVQQTSDGGYIIAGSTAINSVGEGGDVWLVKTDAAGDTVWTRSCGGTANEIGYSVQQTSDGGYIVAGMTESYGAGHRDAYLIKTNAAGDTAWTRTFGGTDYDEARSVQQTVDGGYIITGYTRSYGAGDGDVWLIKTDAAGNTVTDGNRFAGPRSGWTR